MSAAQAGPLLARLPPGLRRQYRLAAPDVVVRRLAGGTAETYRIEATKGHLVARLSAPRPSHEVTVERVALAHAERLGVGPDLVWSSADGALLLTRALPGRALRRTDLRCAVTANAAGALLRRLHSSRVRFPPADVPGLLVRLQRDLATCAVHPALDTRMQGLVAAICAATGPSVPSHGDAHAANWIDTGAGLRLVDWEFARSHEPAWDLATVALEIGPDGPGVESLLDGYGADDAVRSRLWPVALLVLVVDGVWSLAHLKDEVRAAARLDRARCLAARLFPA